MTLYLVRHTRVEVAPGICYGQSDVPLADSFKTESESILAKLSEIQFEDIFCSPLSRCVELGHLFTPEVKRDDRLKELNFGEWEGLAWDTVFESDTGKKWFTNYLKESCPKGESYQDMLRRVKSFIADLPDTDGNILIITHAGVIRAFSVLVKKWSVKKAFDKPVDYGQITVIEKKTSKSLINK